MSVTIWKSGAFTLRYERLTTSHLRKLDKASWREAEATPLSILDTGRFISVTEYDEFGIGLRDGKVVQMELLHAEKLADQALQQRFPKAHVR